MPCARGGGVIVRLDPEQLAELARLIAAELQGSATATSSLVDAAELAERLGVDRSWVYEHAAELGARRLGEGSRPRLRFDVAEAERRLASCSASRGSTAPAERVVERSAARRRRRGSGSGAPLLPIRAGSGG
jgi:hypothetical protein